MDPLGCNLLPSLSGTASVIYAEKVTEVEVAAVRKLSALPLDGTLNSLTARFAGVVATFEARKIDLQSAWEKLQKSGGVPGA